MQIKPAWVEINHTYKFWQGSGFIVKVQAIRRGIPDRRSTEELEFVLSTIFPNGVHLSYIELLALSELLANIAETEQPRGD